MYVEEEKKEEDSKGKIARRSGRDGSAFGATGHRGSGSRGEDPGPNWWRVVVVVMVMITLMR